MGQGQRLALGLVNAMTRAWPGFDHRAGARDYLEDRGQQVIAGHEWMAACAVRTLLFSDRSADAARYADVVHSTLGERNPVGWRARITSLRASAALLDGDVQAAVDLGERALRMMQPRRWGTRIGEPLSVAVIGNVILGRLGTAAHYLRTAPSAVIEESSHALWYRYALGTFYLSTGNHRGAAESFMSCGRSLAEWGIPLDDICEWRLSAAAAYQLAGERDIAAHLVDLALRERLDEIRKSAADGDESLNRIYRATRESTLSALSEFSSEPDFYLMLRDMCGDGLGLSAAKFAARPAAMSRPISFLATLTDSELKVASLVGQGRHNKEVARELNITTSTVEQHLTRVYRKLGVRNRRELRSVVS
ncbi:helix-turn-helix transcriptional regulator [Frankia sp. R82]|uniref:helix-turn-helix transcriptional regulator n=1 Tax=Frankia sp. R82 TaxID=2950553 RepID=UPI0020448ADB|nr:helix-turn-helix transcriptional regulator [Frankia sp. R82]MCM3887558.1 helix-turn-helix transcriptional regulator [Frankia sp. R82]